MQKHLLFILLLFSVLPCFHQVLFAQQTEKAQSDSTIKKGALFELSFGQNLLFISPSRQNAIQQNRSLVVPTSAVLFFAEFRPERRLKVPVFFNLPTESKQFIQPDGSIKNERASPSFGSGLEFRLFGIELRKNLRLEVEAGPLLSIISDFRSELIAAPILAGRIRIRSGDSFVMYLGGSFTPGLNAFGLFYGTGTNF
jgi:hypothetical protein